MERKPIERRVKDGSVSRHVLSWMLLALFFTHDCIRMDEHIMDGNVCSNNFSEKVWSKGIWIARGAGIVFVIAGFLSITGIIPIITEEWNAWFAE